MRNRSRLNYCAGNAQISICQQVAAAFKRRSDSPGARPSSNREGFFRNHSRLHFGANNSAGVRDLVLARNIDSFDGT